MSILITSISNKMPDWVQLAISQYVKRCAAPWNMDLITIPLQKRGTQAEKAILKEWQQLASHLKTSDRVIGLDPTGKSLTTHAFHATLSQELHRGQRMVFVIGAPEGLSVPIRERCDEFWSLGALTMAHTLAKVVLVEQVFRAWSLDCGHPYHRE